MASLAATTSQRRIVYPETDGAPIAENTLQFDWISKIKGGLDFLFAAYPDVFVAGDLFWYPVEGHPEIVMAPDVMVAFGRPKGPRGSYRQWEEGGVAPQVVFEVLSPSNRLFGAMLRKFEFYQRYGVEEYYIYDPDPDRLRLDGFTRKHDLLVEVPTMDGFVSPWLGVRFELTDDGLQIVRPDQRPIVAYEELASQEERQRELLNEQRAIAEQQRVIAEQQRQLAEQERRRANEATQELDRLRKKLESLGQDPGI